MSAFRAGSGPSVAPRWAALAALVLLLATADERSFGTIPDGQEMLSAGAAVASFGEIGVSRDWINAPERPAGDAVSRFGMGLSLLETVPATLARALAAARPAAFSTPLFVLVPILSLVAGAWALARAASRLGAPVGVALATGLSLAFSTFLWGYATSDYSEAVQAGLLSVLVLSTVELRAGAEREDAWAVAAGIAAAGAVLVKSLLLVAVVPVLAVALLRETRPEGEFGTGKRARKVAPPGRIRRPLLVASGAGLLVWAAFEIVRFGRLFGGYPGEDFSYPPFAGLLRLTFLPNKGLVFYAPLVLLAPWGFARLVRRDARLAWGLALSALSVLVAISAWWAWDGQAGWGPRLLAPALPPLVLLAGVAASDGGRLLKLAGGALAVAGVCVNALGALVPFPQLYALASLVPPQPITEGRAAGTAYEIWRRPDGSLLASGPHHLSLTPSWSPIRLHGRLLGGKLKGEGRPSFPDLDPPFAVPWPGRPAPAVVAAAAPFGWPFWGRAWASPLPGTVDPYRDALSDQLVRALDVKDVSRAYDLGARLTGPGPVAPDARVVAMAADAARLLGRNGESERLLATSPEPCHAWIVNVRLLLGGDAGCLPEGSREGFRRSVEAARAAGVSLPGWERTLSRRAGP